MKNKENILIVSVALFFILSSVFAFLYFTNSAIVETNVTSETMVTDIEEIDKSDVLQIENYLDDLPMQELSDTEIESLLLMREEEKLAHDVYTTLYEIWGQRIFNNIASSEQSHTDMVGELLVKYDLEDPSIGNNIGEFTNEVFTDLYDTLVEQGSVSLVEALKVGATIEDLDIIDLEEYMDKIDNEDILAVYQNLLKGSRNHMRSFTRLLNRNGATYETQYMTDAEYDEIITSPSENGVIYDSTGNAQ